MEARIEKRSKSTLVGRSMKMSLSADRTGELWSSFMPYVRRIAHREGTDFYNVQFYDEDFHHKGVDPDQLYVKWAAVVIEEGKDLPNGLESFILPEGLYAVFLHKGPAAAFPKTIQYIYGQWFPNSEYQLDDRPHFEVLPENYRPDDPEATEEIWMPIRPK